MPWIMCRPCQGEEGEMVSGEWVDCECCQGSGGRPEGPEGEKNWSCACEPEQGVTEVAESDSGISGPAPLMTPAERAYNRISEVRALVRRLLA